MIRLSKYVVIGAIVSATSSIVGLGVSLCGRRYPDDFVSLPIRAALAASGDPYTDITYPMIRLAGSRAWLIGGRLAPLSIVGFSYAQNARRRSCHSIFASLQRRARIPSGSGQVFPKSSRHRTSVEIGTTVSESRQLSEPIALAVDSEAGFSGRLRCFSEAATVFASLSTIRARNKG
jgi:hypothetical protein